MPLVSKAQMRWMYAKKPEMAKEWVAHTPDLKGLPEHVAKKKHEKKGLAEILKAAQPDRQAGSLLPDSNPANPDYGGISPEALLRILHGSGAAALMAPTALGAGLGGLGTLSGRGAAIGAGAGLGGTGGAMLGSTVGGMAGRALGPNAEWPGFLLGGLAGAGGGGLLGGAGANALLGPTEEEEEERRRGQTGIKAADLGPYQADEAAMVRGLDDQIAVDKRNRSNYPVSYLLNPFLQSGPLFEVGRRLRRRLAASRATSTPLTAASAGFPLLPHTWLGAPLAMALGGQGRQDQARDLYDQSEAGRLEEDERGMDASISQMEKQRVQRKEERQRGKQAGLISRTGPYATTNAATVSSLDKQIAAMNYNREHHPVHYWLNPFVAGPLSQLIAAQQRRQAATRATTQGLAIGSELLGGEGSLMDAASTIYGGNLAQHESRNRLEEAGVAAYSDDKRKKEKPKEESPVDKAASLAEQAAHLARRLDEEKTRLRPAGVVKRALPWLDSHHAALLEVALGPGAEKRADPLGAGPAGMNFAVDHALRPGAAARAAGIAGMGSLAALGGAGLPVAGMAGAAAGATASSHPVLPGAPSTSWLEQHWPWLAGPAAGALAGLPFGGLRGMGVGAATGLGGVGGYHLGSHLAGHFGGGPGAQLLGGIAGAGLGGLGGYHLSNLLLPGGKKKKRITPYGAVEEEDA